MNMFKIIAGKFFAIEVFIKIKVLNRILEWVYLTHRRIKLSFAIKLCDLKQQAYNKRFYVIELPNGELTSISRVGINLYKKLKRLDKSYSHLDLMEDCYYYTPLYRNNDGKITKELRDQKRKDYLFGLKVKKYLRF